MRKLYCLICLIGTMVFSPVFAGDAPLVRAQVGPSPIKGLPVGPEVIVMQDANGKDVLVVFYKLDNQQVGFVVGQTSLESGAIDWERKEYLLKTTVMKADEFTPAPVMMDGVLYLFGREYIKNKGRYYIYNAFTSVEDLKALTEGSSHNRPYKSLGVRGQEDLGNIDAVNQEGTLLLTYLQRIDDKHSHVPVSSSLCTANEQYVLTCKSVPMSSDKFDDPTVQIPLTINGQSELVMMVRGQDKHPVLFHWDSMNKAWNKLYTIGKFKIPGVSVGALQIDGMLHLYFKEADGTSLTETSIYVSELLSPSGYWGNPVNTAYATDVSAMSVEYRGRAYVFYATEKYKVCNGDYCTVYLSKLYYYSDTFVQ